MSRAFNFKTYTRLDISNLFRRLRLTSGEEFFALMKTIQAYPEITGSRVVRTDEDPVGWVYGLDHVVMMAAAVQLRRADHTIGNLRELGPMVFPDKPKPKTTTLSSIVADHVRGLPADPPIYMAVERFDEGMGDMNGLDIQQMGTLAGVWFTTRLDKCPRLDTRAVSTEVNLTKLIGDLLRADDIEPWDEDIERRRMVNRRFRADLMANA